MPSPARDFKDKNWIKVRNRTFARDKYRCKWCGKTRTRKNVIQAHHIKTWAAAPLLRFEISNLITLCYECHQKVWGKEREFESLFKSLIEKSEGTMDSLLWLLQKNYEDTES